MLLVRRHLPRGYLGQINLNILLIAWPLFLTSLSLCLTNRLLTALNMADRLCATVREFDIFKEAPKYFTDLLPPELLLAMRTLFYENTCRLQLVDAIVAKQSIALLALVGLRWHLVTDDTHQLRGVYFNTVTARPVKLNLSLWKLVDNFLNFTGFSLHFQSFKN